MATKKAQVQDAAPEAEEAPAPEVVAVPLGGNEPGVLPPSVVGTSYAPVQLPAEPPVEE
jgi:hypothetical protein